MINLLPAELKNARIYAQRNVVLVKSVLFLQVVVAVLGVMIGLGYASLNATANRIVELSSEKQSGLVNLESLQKQAQEVSDTINTANTLLGRETRFSELIQQLGGVMPSGAALKSLRLNGDKTQPLSITATLANVDQAPILQQNLLASGLFEAADILNVQRIQANTTSGGTASETTEATYLATFKKETKTKNSTTPAPTPSGAVEP